MIFPQIMVLGLEAVPKDETDVKQKCLSNADIETLIQQRQDARKKPNFAASYHVRLKTYH